MRKIKGFTVAEILITLIIMGVVAGLFISGSAKSRNEVDITPKDAESLYKQTEAVNTYENRIRSGIDNIALSNSSSPTISNDFCTVCPCPTPYVLPTPGTDAKLCLTEFRPLCSKYSALGKSVNPVINTIYFKTTSNKFVMALAIYDSGSCAISSTTGDMECEYYLYRNFEGDTYNDVKNRFLGFIDDAQTVYPQVANCATNLPVEVDFSVWNSPVYCPAAGIKYKDLGLPSPPYKNWIKEGLEPSGHVKNIVTGGELYICKEDEVRVSLDIADYKDDTAKKYNIRAYDEVWTRQMIDRKIERGASLSKEECDFVNQYDYRTGEASALCPSVSGPTDGHVKERG